MTGMDANEVKRLPDTDGMKNEVIVQKNHRISLFLSGKQEGVS